MNDDIRYVANGDVQLCVERRGSGPKVLLFAHGWISARRMWYDVIDRLDPQAYTSYAFDFRGCGTSDRPEYGHDLEGYASDLRTVLDAIDEPLTLVAHSMGGKLAQYVAAQHPSNLERLILVAPGTTRAVRFSPRHRELALAAYGSRERIERFQRAAMAREVGPETMLRLVDDALIAQREAWFGWYDHGRALDVSACLASIEVPSIAVAGGADPLAPPSRVKSDVAQAIRGCVFLMLRNAGHNLPVEAPDEIAGVIAKFR